MSRNQSRVSRRDFARFLALSGSVFLPARARILCSPGQRRCRRRQIGLTKSSGYRFGSSF